MGEKSPRPVIDQRRDQMDRIDVGVARPKCSKLECPRSTANGKPYCCKHIEMIPYAAELIAQLEKRKEQREKLTEAELFFEDVVIELRLKGQSTIEGLARALRLPLLSMGKILRAMKRSGLIRLGKNSRNSITAELV